MELRRVRDDEIEALTRLVNRAYAEQAARGFLFVGSHQDAAVTRDRIRGRECWVGVLDGRLLATVTVTPPGPAKPLAEAGCVTYTRAGLAKVNLFAVDPDHRKRGYGRRLMDHAERRAAELGAEAVALDTAAGARDNLAYYERRGYRIVDRADWRPTTNYESVVLLLELPRGA